MKGSMKRVEIATLPVRSNVEVSVNRADMADVIISNKVAELEAQLAECGTRLANLTSEAKALQAENASLCEKAASEVINGIDRKKYTIELHKPWDASGYISEAKGKLMFSLTATTPIPKKVLDNYARSKEIYDAQSAIVSKEAEIERDLKRVRSSDFARRVRSELTRSALRTLGQTGEDIIKVLEGLTIDLSCLKSAKKEE
jgi:hypothetical protein